MPGKKREVPTDEKLTLQEVRSRIRELKPIAQVEGTGSGTAVPYNKVSKPPRPKGRR